MIYQKYEGNEAEVNILNSSSENPYTGIGDKAFLSCKSIKKLVLPQTISEIGNWGMAHMKQLEELVIPPKSIRLGKEVFLDCPKLTKICVLPDETNNVGLPYLFAASIMTLGDMSLFRPDLIAHLDTVQSWFASFDNRLVEFLDAADDDRFHPVLIGWFDDEGEDSQRRRYMKQRQIEKAKLCFLRLQYDAYMSDSAKQAICKYMLMHVPGGSRETEHTAVWDLLKSELGKDIGTIKRLEANGIIDAKRRVLLIEEMNRNVGNPEVVSYLLAKQQEENHAAFFAGLDL